MCCFFPKQPLKINVENSLAVQWLRLSTFTAWGRFNPELGLPCSVQSLCCVRLFATPWNAARQASPSITNSQSSPRLTSFKSVMPSSHLILCCPLLLLPPVPPRDFALWYGKKMFLNFNKRKINVKTIPSWQALQKRLRVKLQAGLFPLLTCHTSTQACIFV